RMRIHPVLYATTCILAGLLSVGATARQFSDVPTGHIYALPIEELVSAGVIGGNPDGNFAPERSVNRAEMLKMLYAATGREPDPAHVRCFSDIVPGSWYEPYVCDAAARRFVSGYPDGMFRPGNPVNRVEALKMIAEVFEFDVGALSEQGRDILSPLTDVSMSEWYARYLAHAYQEGVLPIAGQGASRFLPEQELLRGESAAMVHNALQARRRIQQQTGSAEGGGRRESSNTEDDAIADDNVERASFPFVVQETFGGRKVRAYTFPVANAMVVDIEVSLQSGQTGEVQCTLYRMEESGFSERYFLGTVEGKSCYMLAAVEAGEYQLQLQSTNVDAAFTLRAEQGTGDGNDGFVEAQQLPIGTSRTHTIAVNNLQNWYTFRVADPAGRHMKLELSNAAQLQCIVYAMDDVDIFGFAGPQCNEFYTYPEGTYYVSVGRAAPRLLPLTYTIILRE
ncbi:MAG: S-layer homology domain-containing protein, partial [Candidatus Peribacteraceae bacterium]